MILFKYLYIFLFRLTYRHVDLDELAKRIPGDKYISFSKELGIEYNHATNILDKWNKNYQKASREVLADWDDRSEGHGQVEANLKTLLNNCGLSGLLKNWTQTE